MKRFFACIMILFLFPLCACSRGTFPFPAQASTPTPAASPTPSPAPVIPRVIAVFGAEEAGAFLDGIRAAAEGTDTEVIAVSEGVSALASYQPEGDAVAIVYLSGAESTLPKTNIPVFAFAAGGQILPADLLHLTYNGTGAAKITLENALNYPPHLSPVRMLGLFSGETSAAYLIWTEAKTTGKVFAKQEFFADTSEVALADWLSDAFSRYYPGMLDAIYAETGALAVAAADTLASLGRDDIEVFSAGTDEKTAGKLSSILVCAVGANPQNAGARCFAEAFKLLSGESAESSELQPESFWYPENP